MVGIVLDASQGDILEVRGVNLIGGVIPEHLEALLFRNLSSLFDESVDQRLAPVVDVRVLFDRRPHIDELVFDLPLTLVISNLKLFLDLAANLVNQIEFFSVFARLTIVPIESDALV